MRSLGKLVARSLFRRGRETLKGDHKKGESKNSPNKESMKVAEDEEADWYKQWLFHVAPKWMHNGEKAMLATKEKNDNYDDTGGCGTSLDGNQCGLCGPDDVHH